MAVCTNQGPFLEVLIRRIIVCWGPLRGHLFMSPYKKGDSMLGSVLGPPICGNLYIWLSERLLHHKYCFTSRNNEHPFLITGSKASNQQSLVPTIRMNPYT